LGTVEAQIHIRPLENTIGLYYEKEQTIRVSNDNWKIMVYKDITLLQSVFKDNKNILENLQRFVSQESDSIRFVSFIIPLKPHVQFLDHIIKRLDNKFSEILLETPGRSKRGVLNGLGSIWKTLTGNLDSSDGEYYDQCINKLEKDDREIQNLIKEQIQVTTSTIKNFNYTIQKLQIDEQTFNDDLKIIEDEINKIEDNNYYFNNQLKLINTCEQLLESLVLIESQVNDIIESITFAKLKVLHPSIIKPEYLLNQLSRKSQHLDHNNLPLHPSVYALPVLTNLVTLQAYQTNKRIVFILRIPLIEKEKYTLYHLYSIPTKDSKTNLFHTIIPESKYVALSENNRQYLKINSIEKCKDLQEETLLCSDLIPFPYENPPCEVLTKLTKLTFAIITIIVVVAIIVYVICSKCRLFKGLVGYFKGSHSDDGPPRPGSCCPQIFNYCNIRSNISRRPSIRIETDDHSEEVAYQRDIPLTSLSTKRRL
jgi:hypothetical protein